ncbi:MAG: CinA family protein [Chloroflexi bacterium]|nr:CinA family protein [Chloroflexota bacterium]MDA1173265.1 CinA family protein [Chloroflexota bacterium]
MFLTDEQSTLALEIAELLIARGEKVAVSESTTGGLVSAALLSVGGASKYFAGGGVVYTLASRTALAGVPEEQYANYQGTTPEMLATLAEAMRQRLDATWCIAESGLAGPTGGRFGAPAGKTTLSVAGPVVRTEVMLTGIADRVENMVEFTTLTLRFLKQAIQDANG